MKISKEEERKNPILDFENQNYRFMNSSSMLNFIVYYYDNTSIKYDNYISFLTTFNNRLRDIKEIDVLLYLSYSVKSIHSMPQYYSQSIRLYFYENKATMDFALDSTDRRLDDDVEYIKDTINSSSVKYDKIIKSKSMIKNIIGVAKGFIPATIIGVGLLFVSEFRNIVSDGYILFPLIILFLTEIFSNMFFIHSITNLYRNIIPEVVYAGYSKSNNSIYKEDINNYVETSEILIGKNIDNMIKRKTIEEKYAKYRRLIPFEIVILIIISIIVIFL
jgi:hypothetical protein